MCIRDRIYYSIAMEGYEVKDMIGKGAHSKVHRVIEKSTGNEYAMKVVRIPNSEHLKASTQLQTQLLKLSNPNFMRHIEFFAGEKELVAIIEYCSGGTLAEVIQRNRGKVIPENLVVKFMAQMLIGLNYLHANGLTHKNLRPSNILLDSQGNIKIASPITLEKLVYDTYSSPQVIEGHKYTIAGDIRSLGCIFHELCCLKAMHQESVKEIVEALHGKAYGGSGVSEQYSRGIKYLIAEMLSSEERPNCEELLKTELVQNYLQGQHESYENEDRYDGEWKRGAKNGRGTLHFGKFASYEGEFKDDKMHGKGKLTYANGSWYEGKFRNNEMDGKGTLQYASGSIYVGSFKDSSYYGQGKFTFNVGRGYRGEWRNGHKSGQGEVFTARKVKYEGGLKKGMKHGKGTYQYENGSKYVGEWRNDKIHGAGIYYWTNGNNYEGEWRDGKRHGKGVFNWYNGDKYTGEFKKDVKNGKGIFSFANGNKYEGEWENGTKHGEGMYYYNNGDKYEGQWKDLSLIHICRCRRIERCRSRWSPYH
eukprot:TRINITY_DN998_c0_g1_i7.p1 TRINITY_DN998_c0_g1~~TRINITY_DN998_c0_g1_i7.p1  ORF type:complete len:533 (-),score=100.80 TRINITY_DN998_c0_g1_i7:22-1620(-)